MGNKLKTDELKGIDRKWTYTENNIGFVIEKIHDNCASDIIYTLGCLSIDESEFTYIGDYLRRGDAVRVKNYIIKLMRMAKDE